MRRIACVCLVVMGLVPPVCAEDRDSGGQTRLPAREATAADAALPATVTFVRRPTWNRVRHRLGAQTIEDVTMRAAVSVADANGTGAAAVAVKLFARSAAGVFRTALAVTNEQGVADVELALGMSPGSSQIVVQACLVAVAACTGLLPVRLADWTDAEINLDIGYLLAPLPSDLRTNAIQADSVFTAVLSPRIQVDLSETEREWRSSSVSAFVTMPIVFQHRALGIPFWKAVTAEQARGIGDVSTGVSVRVAGTLTVDLAYNARNGEFNLIDSIHSLATPRATNLSDGLESIDLSVQLTRHLGRSRHAFFVSGFGSRAVPRVLSQDRRITRDDFYQGMVGVALVPPAQSSAVLLWTGYGHFGATTLAASTTPASRTTTIVGERHEAVIGLTRTPLLRGPVGVTTGITAGGFGGARKYLSINVRLTIRPF